jgi:phosphatidylglycerophosphate synthase
MMLLTSSVWVTIVPVFVINLILFILLMMFTFTRKRPDTPDDLKNRHTSKFLNTFFKEWWYWVTEPIARFFVKIRLSPNIITSIGFLVSVISAFFFASGLFGYAGWIMIFGATFDLFDGKVARITGRSSRSGAYFDSVMDRFGEGVVFIGLAYYYRTSWILIPIIIGLIGSTLVSYTRARGEGVGVICKKGAMQRPERIVYLGVASIFQPVLDSILMIFWNQPPAFFVIGAILLIAVMTNITAIQRIIYIMNELDTIDKDEEVQSIPKLLSSFSTKEGREQWWTKAKYGYDRTEALKKLCIMILVDGANYDVFNELVSRGELPNISRYIIEPGSFKKAVSTFPSTTGPAFTPFVTGCFAGTSDVPGIRWFDRRVPPSKKLTIKRFRDYYGWGSYALDYDLSKSVKTVFEYSRRAINIMGMLNRGAGVTRDPAFFKIPFLFYKVKKSDDVEAVERSAFRMFANALKRSPDFVFYYFPTIDKYSHEYHRSHDLVLEAYSRLDSYVGKMVDLLKDQGLFETTSIMLTSDHGHSNVDTHFDLDAFFEDRFRTLYVPSKFREWMSAEAINMVSGNSMSNVYLKKDAWNNYNFFEDIERSGVIDELLERQAVDIIAGRSADGGVVAVSKKGRARIIEGADGRVSYLVSESDPFGYGSIQQNLSEEDLLTSTWNCEYPDGILQLAQIFRSPRCGDIVISASSGHDLRDRFEKPPHNSTHGSLRSEHMFVPLCVNAKIKNDYVRTADTFPTILRLLGILPNHKLDGKSLI